MGPVGPRWAPCWPHEPCYQGYDCVYFCEQGYQTNPQPRFEWYCGTGNRAFGKLLAATHQWWCTIDDEIQQCSDKLHTQSIICILESWSQVYYTQPNFARGQLHEKFQPFSPFGYIHYKQTCLYTQRFPFLKIYFYFIQTRMKWISW